MAKAKSKIPASTFRVPQNREEASEFIAKIGDDERLILRITADLDQNVALLTLEAESQKGVIELRIAEHKVGLRTWCDANREVLTDGYKVKSANLGTGEVLWRSGPEKVKIKDVAAALETIKGSKRYKGFLRVKYEIDREAMKRAKPLALEIEGVSFSPDPESFSVEPLSIELSDALA